MTSIYLRIGEVLLILLAVTGALYGAYQHGVTVAESEWRIKWVDQFVIRAQAVATAMAGY
ncbi:hypothetical protein [Pseudomonas viridiflava]|uniref:hypothetical protein n=1 Tax=Pseudomonas viridiflava TaxID=33069 RepID=UPI000F030E5D|nr:hypothetical protein [Pseudomonas viridiflava]